jgi:acyl-CoA reductase-like NAD-dependent aldehyde dehydrogenase
MKTYDQFYIGGEWRKPAGSGTIDVIDSGTEAVIGRIPEGLPADAQDAIRAARSKGNGDRRARRSASRSSSDSPI